MVSTLIQSEIFNTVSHPTSVEYSKLIMTLEEHYVTEEKVVRNITGEIVLDL